MLCGIVTSVSSAVHLPDTQAQPHHAASARKSTAIGVP